MRVKAPQSTSSMATGGFGFIVLLLIAVLILTFTRAGFDGGTFRPGHTLFSNDGPLGGLMAHWYRFPEMFTGSWNDLNTVGTRVGEAPPSITNGLVWLLGPVGFSKFYAVCALFILGASAWCCFRAWGLAPIACVLGAVAAMLNGGFFSIACWGLGTASITFGMAFLALAALADTASPRRWVRVALAGLAVGMGVSEGSDIGAIFSLYIAAYVVYQAWIAEGARGKNMVVGFVRLALVAGFAAFLAAQAMSGLIATNIAGVARTAKPDEGSKLQSWDFATQWSLPKREALGMVVPGLFGYRMDTPEGLPSYLQAHYAGGNYWGATGRDPSWDRYFASGKQGPQPPGFIRYGGGAPYAGILVELVALWAALQAFRRQHSVFSPATRRTLWFWIAVVVVSLLLAFGRFAPFYQLFYALPYASAIRNPTKFLHPLTFAVIVLFAYGINGLWRRYMEGAPEASPAGATGVAPALAAKGKRAANGRDSNSASRPPSLTEWWKTVRGFDRRWTLGCLVALALSALAWLIYGANKDSLVNYLTEVGFNDPNNGQAAAKAIASFSIGQVGWFILFFAAAIALITLVLSGRCRGARARWWAVALGIFVVVDLGLADQPWIITWNYKQKYASDQVLDFLKDKPYEHRAAGLPDFFSSSWFQQVFRVQPQLAGVEQYFRHGLYGVEWAQQQFPYYNIQSLDIIQMPRMPEDLMAFKSVFEIPFGTNNVEEIIRRMGTRVPRYWQITNTRYLLGAAGWLDFLNQQLDPSGHRFHLIERFDMAPKPGLSGPPKDFSQMAALPATNGPFAIYEFTGALPRAKLYASWQITTNDNAALEQLASPSFDPEKSLIVSSALDVVPMAGTNVDAGTVEFSAYAPKDLSFKAKVSAPSVLLLNDRYDPNWKVFVDGTTKPLLKCNYLMRGVYLTPGIHAVEFRFEPTSRMLYVSLAALLVGLLLCGILLLLPKRTKPPAPPTSEPVTTSDVSKEMPKPDLSSFRLADGRRSKVNFGCELQ